MNPESKIKNAGRMNVAVLYEDDVELPLFPDQNKYKLGFYKLN